MILTVIGHLTIDSIQLGSLNIITLGGSAIYSSLIIKRLGGEINLITKYGKDMPKEYFSLLSKNQIKIPKYSISNNSYTTKFKIIIEKTNRKIFLKSKCENIYYPTVMEGNGAIISPVAGEIDNKILKKIRNDHQLIFLDPQGFIRKFRNNGECFYKKINKNILKYCDIIKFDESEAYWVTGKKEPIKALKELKNLGLKISIFTRGSKGIILQCEKGLFKIPIIRRIRPLDTTGVGDIFTGAFTFTLLQNRDPIWAGCVAVASSSIGIDKIGVYKIPTKEIVIKIAKEILGRVEQIDNI